MTSQITTPSRKERLNKKISSSLNVAMIAILIIIPSGLIYRFIEEAIFLKNCPDKSCGSWMGILYLVLIPAEIYLAFIFILLRKLRKSNANDTLKLILLILIFMLGVIPGLLLIYPAFFKN